MTPSARTLLSKPRLGRTVSSIVLTQRPIRKAMASQTSAASTRGMASAMVLSMFVAGSEIAETCRICSAPMAAKMMMIARHGDADRAGDRVAGGSGALRGSAAFRRRPAGLSPMLMPARPSSRSRLSAPSAASMTWRTMRARIRPGEEEEAGAEQPRQEGEDLVGQRGDRGQHSRQAERLERGDQPDQPDEPVSEAAELVADRVAAGLRVALQDRHPVDQPWRPPTAPPWR